MQPAPLKAFAQGRGTRAKTDRIDGKVIFRFFAFHPEAGRSLPAEKLRFLGALKPKRPQRVRMCKPPLAQIRANRNLDTVVFKDIDAGLKQGFDIRIKEPEDRITRSIPSDDPLPESAKVLRSIPATGPVASTRLTAGMPKIGTLTGSGTRRGKRVVAGGRHGLRHVMFQVAIVAAQDNPGLKPGADRPRRAGKPHRVIIPAVARRSTIAKAPGKNHRNRAAAVT